MKIPPHVNEDPHRRLMERLRSMSPEEVFQTLVDAGIYTPDGELTSPYRDLPPSEE